MSISSTTTNPDWLHNSHAGELLLSEFLEPLDLSPEALSAAIEMPASHIRAVIDGAKPMDAELDLRLGRYFRMSEGFFLRLQDSYELRLDGTLPARDARDRNPGVNGCR